MSPQHLNTSFEWMSLVVSHDVQLLLPPSKRDEASLLKLSCLFRVLLLKHRNRLKDRRRQRCNQCNCENPLEDVCCLAIHTHFDRGHTSRKTPRLLPHEQQRSCTPHSPPALLTLFRASFAQGVQHTYLQRCLLIHSFAPCPCC